MADRYTPRLHTGQVDIDGEIWGHEYMLLTLVGERSSGQRAPQEEVKIPFVEVDNPMEDLKW